MSAIQTALAPLPLAHLAAMSGEFGLFEHADGCEPRLEHGYCTDDVARALTVVVREPEHTALCRNLIERYLDFLERAVAPDGTVHNRMSAQGRWTDRASTGDWWGRAVAGLGSAVRYAPDASIRARALRAFLRAASGSSADVRASAFAAIGAADVLAVSPGLTAARILLITCLDRIPRGDSGAGDWPEPRLRYANAALPRALIVGGAALRDDATTEAGLAMLGVLLRIETSPEGHLSVTGSAGRDLAQPGPLWDQQPIEAAGIADACLDALVATGNASWAREIMRAWAWFTGDNDAGVTMIAPLTGAGFDGLEPGGRNENCGAESTLAALSTNRNARVAHGWLS